MIALLLIISGFGLTGLGVWNFRDWRAGKSQFEPIDYTELDVWSARIAKMTKFNNHLDIWGSLILGPPLIAVGIYSLFK